MRNSATIAEAEICFRKFVDDRRACRGRMRNHHVINSAQGCCRKYGQGYAEQVRNRVIAKSQGDSLRLRSEKPYIKSKGA